MAGSISLGQYQALQEGAGFLVRGDRGRLALRGEDRKAYLQGLLSNDILGLQPGGSLYATLLTAQGRMISDMRVFDGGEVLLVDLEREITPAVAEHLEKFVITEDVVIEDVTSTWSQIGVYGPRSGAVIDTVTGAGLEPSFVLTSSDLGVEGVDVIVPAGAVDAFTASLEQAGAVRVDDEVTEVTRVEAGIPKFLVDMDSTTIPLEAGIEDRAISMTKGCYVGQEVIIRVLHRGGGRVAKKLASLDVDGPAARDDRIFAGEREVGRITSTVDSPRYGKRIALGYVHRDFLEPGTALTVRSPSGLSSALVTRRV